MLDVYSSSIKASLTWEVQRVWKGFTAVWWGGHDHCRYKESPGKLPRGKICEDPFLSTSSTRTGTRGILTMVAAQQHILEAYKPSFDYINGKDRPPVSAGDPG